MLAGTRSITHAALDELPDSYAIEFLRAALVRHGALPDRDEVLHRFERWIKGFPHGMPTTEAETINADLLAFLQS